VLACALLLAPTAWAQQGGGIAGQVTDETDGALPGVTVEINSPALIGGTQVVYTDGEGRYNAINLPLGIYSATYTLPGFSVVVRDGLDIGAGFTAQISVQLAVGNLQETITVSGVTPVIDVQSVRQQRTLPQAELEALPSGNIGLQTLAAVTPGFGTTRADVGGSRDTWAAQGAYTNYHGKPGTRASFNGFRNQYFIGGASGVGYVSNSDTIGEMQLEISGMGAESGSGSTSLDIIPREGSNTFTASVNAKLSNGSMQSENLSDQNRDEFGLTSGEVQKIYRASGTVGGPIVQNKLWFYGAIARWGMRVNQPGQFFNGLQGNSSQGTNANTLLHEFDRNRPAADFDFYRTHSIRMTWQASERNRLSFFGDIQKNCRCTTGFTGSQAIEAEDGWDNWPSGTVQASWASPVSNRVLLEAGYGWQTINWINFSQPGVVDGQDRSILERSTNFRYGADSLAIRPIARTGRGGQYFTLNYVTGSHSIKVGLTTEQAFNDESHSTVHDDTLNYDFRNGLPDRIQYNAQPFFQQERMNMELGLFAQDAWTLDQLTLNVGIRLDKVTMGFPAGVNAAGPYVPERRFDELKGVPSWTDINPRIGGSYDVFSNGRTAIKTSLGRFNALTSSGLTRRFHPLSSSVRSANRDWDDANGNFVPDCVLNDFTANGECGAISNSFFGQFIPSATSFSDDLTQSNREYTWDYLLELQHEIMPGLSVSGGYNRNWTRNREVTDNLSVETGDFSEYCFTVPTDSRVPTSGQEICGNYDINPGLFGQVQNLRTVDSAAGVLRDRTWSGFTMSVDGRFPNGMTLAGGIDLGNEVVDDCYTIDAPNGGNPFCRSERSFGDLADFRLRGSYPFPGGFNASFIYKNLPGRPINTDGTIRRSEVRFPDDTTGTRVLSRSSIVRPFHVVNSNFTDRFTQLDLRMTKSLNFSGFRMDTSLDLYNMLNSDSIQGLRTRYGSTYLQPNLLLDARLLQLSAILSF
jgi:hypothetical protein